MTSNDFLAALYLMLGQKVPTHLLLNKKAGRGIVRRVKLGDIELKNKTLVDMGLYCIAPKTAVIDNLEYQLIGR